jgi:hypothetical protein
MSYTSLGEYRPIKGRYKLNQPYAANKTEVHFGEFQHTTT